MGQSLACIDHPQDQEIQICSNKVPGVTNGHILRDIVLYRFNIYHQQKPLTIFFSQTTGLNSLIFGMAHC